MLPFSHLGPIAVALLAAPVLPLLGWAAWRPSAAIRRAAAVAALPLLCVPAGPGLIAGVAVAACLLRAEIAPEESRCWARAALLWWPVALLAPPTASLPGELGLWLLPAAAAATSALAATLQQRLRWLLALVLAALPVAPAPQALVFPAALDALLPMEDAAARWHHAGPGVVDLASLPWLLAHAAPLLRVAGIAAVLLGWLALHRAMPRLRLWVLALLGGSVALALAHAAAALQLPPHAAGFPAVPAVATGWSIGLVAAALARTATLGFLTLGSGCGRRPGPSLPLDPLAAALAAAAGAILAVLAAPQVGPTWPADPLALGLSGLFVTALVRSRAPGTALADAAGALQIALALGIVGGVRAGLTVASGLSP